MTITYTFHTWRKCSRFPISLINIPQPTNNWMLVRVWYMHAHYYFKPKTKYSSWRCLRGNQREWERSLLEIAAACVCVVG